MEQVAAVADHGFAVAGAFLACYPAVLVAAAEVPVEEVRAVGSCADHQAREIADGEVRVRGGTVVESRGQGPVDR